MSQKRLTGHSAAASNLGYLYQMRVALHLALLKLREGDHNFFVSIESLDDITFESEFGNYQDVIETKHHTVPGSLSDNSVDFWKTLRIWLELTRDKDFPRTVQFFLVTTNTAAVGQAAYYLRMNNRDVNAALMKLKESASTSKNLQNRTTYQMFLETDDQSLSNLLSRITVLDSYKQINDIEESLLKELRLSVDWDYLPQFLTYLEGWWHRRVLKQLTSSMNSNPVAGIEIEQKISDLRDRFTMVSLPIADDIRHFDLDEDTKHEYLNRTFVKQLHLIEVRERRILTAIRDYYRAYEQRSRWLREELVIGLELENYEKNLHDEWERQYDFFMDTIGENAAESEKKKMASRLLHWAEMIDLPLRTNVNAPFLCRGSYHMLADDLRVGWHPDFMDRLKHILESE